MCQRSPSLPKFLHIDKISIPLHLFLSPSPFSWPPFSLRWLSSSTASMDGDGEPSRPRPKTRHKRPPQRGLGVAQLEKIRLEEQQKGSNGAAVAAASSSSSPPPPPPPPPPLPPPPSSSCYQPQSMPVNSNPVMFPPRALFSSSGSSGYFGFPVQWMDHAPESIHWRFRCHPNPVVNRMVSTPASGVHLRMEPPSNQIYYRNYNSMPSSSPYSWTEEDKNLVCVLGMKRPYSVRPNLSSFPYKIPSLSSSFVEMNHLPVAYGDVVSRDPELSSSSYQGALKQKHVELHVDQSKKENGRGRADGGFLSLGPSLTPSSMTKHPIFFSSPNQCASLSYKETVDDDDAFPNFGSSAPITSSSHYYTFFPSGTDIQEDTALVDREETDLDLSLKL